MYRLGFNLLIIFGILSITAAAGLNPIVGFASSITKETHLKSGKFDSFNPFNPFAEIIIQLKQIQNLLKVYGFDFVVKFGGNGDYVFSLEKSYAQAMSKFGETEFDSEVYGKLANITQVIRAFHYSNHDAEAIIHGESGFMIIIKRSRFPLAADFLSEKPEFNENVQKFYNSLEQLNKCERDLFLEFVSGKVQFGLFSSGNSSKADRNITKEELFEAIKGINMNSEIETDKEQHLSKLCQVLNDYNLQLKVIAGELSDFKVIFEKIKPKQEYCRNVPENQFDDEGENPIVFGSELNAMFNQFNNTISPSIENYKNIESFATFLKF